MIDKIEIELVKPDCVIVCEWNRNENWLNSTRLVPFGYSSWQTFWIALAFSIASQNNVREDYFSITFCWILKSSDALNL